jgi:hypothetical protein
MKLLLGAWLDFVISVEQGLGELSIQYGSGSRERAVLYSIKHESLTTWT